MYTCGRQIIPNWMGLKPNLSYSTSLPCIHLYPFVFSLQGALMEWWAWLHGSLLPRYHGTLLRSHQVLILPITSQCWRLCWLKCNRGWERARAHQFCDHHVFLLIYCFSYRFLFHSGQLRQPSQPGLRLAVNTKTQMAPWRTWWRLRSSPTRLLHVSSHRAVDSAVLARGQSLILLRYLPLFFLLNQGGGVV